MALRLFTALLLAVSFPLFSGCGPRRAIEETASTMTSAPEFPHAPESNFRAEPPKTLFQTNMGFHPRIAIPVDGVIVHQHGVGDEEIHAALRSWDAKGFVPQRMFFADSDAGLHYTEGRFDGEEHPDEIERRRDGSPVLCAGVRPYMLPTPGWTRYLEHLARQAIDGGARAILPEEPLGHAATGYEEAFKPMYEAAYGEPWVGAHESPDAFFKTARLKGELYRQLEQDLQISVSEYAKSLGKDVQFIIPIHSLYSNLAAGIVAPLGTSLRIRGHDGYIGQIWSGPVQWALAHYSGGDASFFDGAYILYDYFVNLVLDSPKTLYLLSDPVEDHPGRTWEQYESWYKECVAAKLMFPEIAEFEIMPWPDRIFMPGHLTGGGTPGPEHYRTILMSIATVLQDIPKGAREDAIGGTRGLGMLVGDSAMWQTKPDNSLDSFLGPLFSILKRGIPVASVPVERIEDERYMDRFDFLLLSYDAWKPELETYHQRLRQWTSRGGVLLLFDGRNEFDSVRMFWTEQGLPNPQSHLIRTFGFDLSEMERFFEAEPSGVFSQPVGRGRLVVVRRPVARYADPERAELELLPLIRRCAEAYLGRDLDEPRRFVHRRGPFVIAHAFDDPFALDGAFIDVFDAEVPLRRRVELARAESAILVDVADKLADLATPQLLHATYRLLEKSEEPNRTSFFILGPEKTTGAVRIWAAGRTPRSVEARAPDDESPVAVAWRLDPDGTLLVQFPYRADGLGFVVRWQ